MLLFKSLGEFWSSLTLPFNSQIKFVILHTVNHTILINVSSVNLVLDQQIIPKLIVFFILITYLVDIVSIL